MLTGVARDQLSIILGFLTDSDLRVIELKIVPGTPQSNSSAERIEAILSCAPQPSDVLLQKTMRKPVLRRYLWQTGINVTKEQSKSEYIQILLCMWQVQNDDFLKRYRPKDNTHQAPNRPEPPAERNEVQNETSQHQQEKKPVLDTMTAIQQHCRDPKLSDASSATASTSSPTKSSSSSEKTTQQTSLKRKREPSPDEIIITMEKLVNNQVPATKVENICVTPEIPTYL